MASVLPGQVIWEYNSNPVLTTAASPLLSPWFDTANFTLVLPVYKFTGGTTVVTADGSWDGITSDADLTTLYGAALPASGTAFAVASPWLRIRVVQTIADNTVTKIFLKARA
jgi:hypothetical protein